MVVRAIVGKDQHYSNTLCGPPISNGQIVQAAKASQNNDRQNVDHLEINAVMGNALETLTRYRSHRSRHSLTHGCRVLKMKRPEGQASPE